MFTIKWNNGYENMTMQFYKPCKRLDACNAAYYAIERNTRHNSKEWRFGLISYKTPILDIVVDSQLGIRVNVNQHAFTYSRTTTNHITRFLRLGLYNMPALTSGMLRDAIASRTDYRTEHDAFARDGIVYKLYTEYGMTDLVYGLMRDYRLIGYHE